MHSVSTDNLRVNDFIAIDCQGPYPRTGGGNKFIIVAVECSTRYVIARAIKNITSKICARFVVNDIICRLGVPKTILTMLVYLQASFLKKLTRH